MLKIVQDMRRLNFGALMAVYLEGNRENGAYFYPQLSENEQLLRAEQDAYNYLTECFFKTPGAKYFIWEQEGAYVSALRLEPYQDGLLLEALETTPDARRKGFASALIRAVLAWLEEQGSVTIYSHVSKRNTASLAVHTACGFRRILEHAVYADGSVSQKSCTLCYRSGEMKSKL